MYLVTIKGGNIMKKIKVKKSKSLELTNEMIQRNDDIDNAVYRCILTLSEKDSLELSWNMEIIGAVTEAIKEELRQFDISVRHPGVVTTPRGDQYYEDYSDKSDSVSNDVVRVADILRIIDEEDDILIIKSLGRGLGGRGGNEFYHGYPEDMNHWEKGYIGPLRIMRMNMDEDRLIVYVNPITTKQNHTSSRKNLTVSEIIRLVDDEDDVEIVETFNGRRHVLFRGEAEDFDLNDKRSIGSREIKYLTLDEDEVIIHLVSTRENSSFHHHHHASLSENLNNSPRYTPSPNPFEAPTSLEIKPEWMHDKERLDDLSVAIARSLNSCCDIPNAWVTEYNKLQEKIKNQAPSKLSPF